MSRITVIHLLGLYAGWGHLLYSIRGSTIWCTCEKFTWKNHQFLLMEDKSSKVTFQSPKARKQKPWHKVVSLLKGCTSDLVIHFRKNSKRMGETKAANAEISWHLVPSMVQAPELSENLVFQRRPWLTSRATQSAVCLMHVLVVSLS